MSWPLWSFDPRTGECHGQYGHDCTLWLSRAKLRTSVVIDELCQGKDWMHLALAQLGASAFQCVFLVGVQSNMPRSAACHWCSLEEATDLSLQVHSKP